MGRVLDVDDNHHFAEEEGKTSPLASQLPSVVPQLVLSLGGNSEHVRGYHLKQRLLSQQQQL